MRERNQLGNLLKRICAGICALAVLLAAGGASGEIIEKGSLREILAYIDQNQPTELELRDLALKPKEVTQIREKLPEGAALHFTIKWLGISISDTDEELDMTAIRQRPKLERCKMSYESYHAQRVDYAQYIEYNSACKSEALLKGS